MSVKLIAVHEIVRGPAAKREIIAPKTEFTATDEEAKELLELGAALGVVAEPKPAKGKKAEEDLV